MTNSIFEGMQDAKRGFQTNIIRAGRYVVRIDQCSFFTSDWGPKWKNTLTVLAVEEGDHKVGEVVNTTFTAKQGPGGKDIFQQNLKGFLCGVLGLADDAVDEDGNPIINAANSEAASGEEQPMAGRVTVVTVRKRNSKKGKTEEGDPTTYNVYTWSPELTAKEIEEAIGKDGVKKFFPNGLG